MLDLFARRELFDDEHEALRASVREFLNRNVAGHLEAWDADEDVPRAVWDSAGQQGFLGLSVSEELGGGYVNGWATPAFAEYVIRRGGQRERVLGGIPGRLERICSVS